MAHTHAQSSTSTRALIRIVSLTTAPLALALMPGAALAQTTQELAATIAPVAESGAFMGAALVVKGDEVLLDQAWGDANLEWNIPHTTDTIFRIGSVTKQFTAVSILLLQEQGKLDLDDPIAKHFPGAPDAWQAITLRNLMRHTSGVPDVTRLAGFGRISTTAISQDDLIAMFKDLPLEFEPGSKWSYSNSGYIVLARVIENVSGMPYAQFLKTNLFDPIGMPSTGVDVNARILPKRAAGYTPSQNGPVNAPYINMNIPLGGGSLYSTTHDLHKWQRALFGGSVLSASSLAEFVDPYPQQAVGEDRYAHGIIVEDDADGRSYWHGGGIEGFNAWLGYDPDKAITVVVLANINGGAPSRLGRQLMVQARGE